MSNVKAYLEDIVRDGLHDIAEALKGVGPTGDVQASHVIYDNTESGLTSNRVQGAIDELCTKVDTNASGISDLGDDVSDLTSRMGTAEGDITALETWKDNLDASDIPYGSGTVKDALDGMKIKSATISGTTDTDGNLSQTIPFASRFIISARYDMANANGAVTPMVYAPSSGWYFHCTNNALQPLANTAVTVKYAYVDI